MYGRLKDGVSPAAARDSLRARWRLYANNSPDHIVEGRVARAGDGHRELHGPGRAPWHRRRDVAARLADNARARGGGIERRQPRLVARHRPLPRTGRPRRARRQTQPHRAAAGDRDAAAGDGGRGRRPHVRRWAATRSPPRRDARQRQLRAGLADDCRQPRPQRGRVAGDWRASGMESGATGADGRDQGRRPAGLDQPRQGTRAPPHAGRASWRQLLDPRAGGDDDAHAAARALGRSRIRVRAGRRARTRTGPVRVRQRRRHRLLEHRQGARRAAARKPRRSRSRSRRRSAAGSAPTPTTMHPAWTWYRTASSRRSSR